MRRIFVTLCLSIFALLADGATVEASSASMNADDERRPVTILSFEFPPLLHSTVSGGFSGTMGETVKALCERAKLDCRFKVVPLKRAYRALRSGAADGLITIDLGQFHDCCRASAWSSPWSAGWFSHPSVKQSPEKEGDLKDKSIIVVQGMKSPYKFAPNLNALVEENVVTVSKAASIATSVKMFLRDRAPLLWGGEDFKWYFGKIDPTAEYRYTPRMTLPVVVWMRKERSQVSDLLDAGYNELKEGRVLGANNLLSIPLMQARYQDAPFKMTP